MCDKNKRRMRRRIIVIKYDGLFEGTRQRTIQGSKDCSYEKFISKKTKTRWHEREEGRETFAIWYDCVFLFFEVQS